MSPLIWWRSLRGTNLLADVSIKILSAPTTSAATERSFKAFSDIHSTKRNRLTTVRAAKIAYLAHNWKLKNKISAKKVKTNDDMDTNPSTSTSTSKNSELEQNNPRLRQSPHEVVESDSEYSNTETVLDSSESESDIEEERRKF